MCRPLKTPSLTLHRPQKGRWPFIKTYILRSRERVCGIMNLLYCQPVVLTGSVWRCPFRFILPFLGTAPNTSGTIFTSNLTWGKTHIHLVVKVHQEFKNSWYPENCTHYTGCPFSGLIIPNATRKFAQFKVGEQKVALKIPPPLKRILPLEASGRPPESFRTFWKTPNSSRTFWRALRHSKTFWKPL